MELVSEEEERRESGLYDEEFEELQNYYDDVRNMYKPATREELRQIDNYLELHANIVESSRRGEEDESITIDSFIDETHPLMTPEMSKTSNLSFWKQPQFNGLGKMVSDFFRDACDFNCFEDLQMLSTPAKDRDDGQQEKTREEPSFMNSRNLVVFDDVFPDELSGRESCCIMDTVEFRSIFCDLSIMKNQGILFSNIPRDIRHQFFARGLHLMRFEKKGGCEIVCEFSIDPTYKLKVKEKLDRQEERKERRSIRAMAIAGKERQKFLPNTQTHTSLTGRQMNLMNEGKIGPSGDILDETSSEEDSEEENERRKFEEFITTRTGSRMKEALESDVLDKVPLDEVRKALSEFSLYNREPRGYTLMDYTMRQFFDVNLRIIVFFKLNDSQIEPEEMEAQSSTSRKRNLEITDDESSYTIKSFLFFIQEKIRKEKK